MPYDPTKNVKENMTVLVAEMQSWQRYISDSARDYDKIEQPTVPQKMTRNRLRFMAANVSITERYAKEELEAKTDA